MRFVIEAPADEDSVPVWSDPAALRALDRLVDRAHDAAHEVVLDDADLIEDSEWFRGARASSYDRLLELCELARVSAWRTAAEAPRSWRVCTCADADRALRIANSTLKLLLEDRLRDGALLEVAVRVICRNASCRRRRMPIRARFRYG